MRNVQYNSKSSKSVFHIFIGTLLFIYLFLQITLKNLTFILFNEYK